MVAERRGGQSADPKQECSALDQRAGQPSTMISRPAGKASGECPGPLAERSRLMSWMVYRPGNTVLLAWVDQERGQADGSGADVIGRELSPANTALSAAMPRRCKAVA